MRKLTPVVLIFPVGLMVMGTDLATGQTYPNKPIRMVVGSFPGGGPDFVGRLIAQGLTERLGLQVIVDNRGNLAGEIVSKAPPDGYTVLVDASSLWIAPLIQNMSYNFARDFSPITMIVSSPNILVVHPTVPVKSVKELIALAKAKPGGLNYGSAPTGSSTHLAAELFKTMASVDIVRIPYKGGGPALNDLIAGRVQLIFASAGSVSAHVKAGRLRALAVTSPQPSALFPDLPTVAASGLPGYESVSPYGIFAPAKTPAALINRLNRESVAVVNRVDVKDRLFNAGVEAVGSSPEEFAAAVKSEMAKWGKVIKDAGIRGE